IWHDELVLRVDICQIEKDLVACLDIIAICTAYPAIALLDTSLIRHRLAICLLTIRIDTDIWRNMNGMDEHLLEPGIHQSTFAHLGSRRNAGRTSVSVELSSASNSDCSKPPEYGTASALRLALRRSSAFSSIGKRSLSKSQV